MFQLKRQEMKRLKTFSLFEGVTNEKDFFWIKQIFSDIKEIIDESKSKWSDFKLDKFSPAANWSDIIKFTIQCDYKNFCSIYGELLRVKQILSDDSIKIMWSCRRSTEGQTSRDALNLCYIITGYIYDKSTTALPSLPDDNLKGSAGYVGIIEDVIIHDYENFLTIAPEIEHLFDSVKIISMLFLRGYPVGEIDYANANYFNFGSFPHTPIVDDKGKTRPLNPNELRELLLELIQSNYCWGIALDDIDRWFEKDEREGIINQIIERPIKDINPSLYRWIPTETLVNIVNTKAKGLHSGALGGAVKGLTFGIRNKDYDVDAWFKSTEAFKDIKNSVSKMKDTLVEGDNLYFILDDKAIENFKGLKKTVTRRITDEMFDCIKSKKVEIFDTAYDDLENMYKDLLRHWGYAFLVKDGWIKDFPEDGDNFVFHLTGEIQLPIDFYTVWEEAKKDWHSEIQYQLFFGLFDQFKHHFGYKTQVEKGTFHTRKFLINPLKLYSICMNERWTLYEKTFVEFWVNYIHYLSVELADCGFEDFNFVLTDKVRYKLKAETF